MDIVLKKYQNITIVIQMEGSKTNKQNVSQWAKISVDIRGDAKWRIIKRVIKNEKGVEYRETDICTLFIQYCLASKKARKPVDVRTLVFDREILVDDETFRSTEEIDLVNQYFVKIGLLTKKYTISSYYADQEDDQEEIEQLLKSPCR